MKKGLLKIAAGILLLGIGLSGVSCSKEKATEVTKAPPPGHATMIEEFRQQSVEESKKIVIAKVNGVDITMKELIEMMNEILPVYKTSAGPNSPDLDERVKKEALDLLLFRELALQEAKRQKLKADPKAVDQVINHLMENLGSDLNYRQYVQGLGYTEETFREQIEKDKLFEMITSKEITGKSKVDGQLVRDIYEREKESFIMPENFAVEDVFFPAGHLEPSAAMKKAKETLALIRKNRNDLSSIPPDNALIVRAGGVTRQEYPDIFQAAAGMKAGEVSNVIKERDGLHIVKLKGKEPARQLSFEEASVFIEQKLQEPLMNKRKNEWESELRKKAKIEILDIQDVIPVSALK
jgi:foldase protein PrsA